MPDPQHPDQTPQQHPHTAARSTALAALLAAAVLLPLLGHRPLTDWDEGIYAEISREMLAAHTVHAWLVPHWNGQLWFEKPPLQMWLTALSLRLFGLNAFAARLPSALAGIGTVALLHLWMLRRLAWPTAWLATVLLLSAFGFQHAARAGETDSLLAFFCLIGVLGLAELLRDRAHGWLLFFAGFALALMTKGAASVTLPLAALVLAVVHPRHLIRHGVAFTVGLLGFLAVVLPWHLFLYAQFGRAFTGNYFGFHTLSRATSSLEGHATTPWFYFGVLLVSAPLFSLLYPWALLAPFRLLAGAARTSKTAHHGRHEVEPGTAASLSVSRGATGASPEALQALSVFALVTFALFTLAKTRLPHYVVPIYAPLSGLTAALLVRVASRLSRSHKPVWPFALAGVLAYLLAAWLTAPARSALHSARLLNGAVTPDNRESVRLLQQAAPLLRNVPGRLLVWHRSPTVPVTTTAFYSRHLVQQVSVGPLAPGAPQDRYFSAPIPLEQAVREGARVILLDCSLVPSLPRPLGLTPLAAGPTQVLARLEPSTTVPAGVRELCPAQAGPDEK